MAETTIEWTGTPLPDGTILPGFTMNFWIGCTEVSPACDHCYARIMSHRYGWAEWGNHPRHRTSADNWRKPLAWNAKAKKLGVRLKVFTNSLSDFFDNQVPEEWRRDAYAVIDECDSLDWLILTKRPQNAASMIMKARRALMGNDGLAEEHVTWPWPHVWLGCTVENQEEADRRIPHLLATPAAVRFLSCEPLLGPVNLRPIRCRNYKYGTDEAASVYALDGRYQIPGSFWSESHPSIDWVIAGGESGPGKRPMDLAWMRSLRDQCAAAGVPFFGKQDDKVRELPDDLRIHQFPAAPQ